jgi:hypothetical protein
MYPSETSLIPAAAALLKYFAETGAGVFWQDYPYWYLGSTPFKYLIGPVVPIVFQLARYISPSLSFFDFLMAAVAASIILSALGWGILVKRLSLKEGGGIILTVFIVYMLLPFKYLAAYALDEPTFFIAKCMIPFVIVILARYLAHRSVINFSLSALAVTTLLLISSKSLGQLTVGLLALCLTISYKKGKFRYLSRKFRRVFYALFAGIILATLWYSPGFWLAQLINPGIGGTIGAGVLIKITEFIKNSAPLIVAISVVHFLPKLSNRLGVFALTWFLTFLIISAYRFVANPAFWMDWSSHMGELETGIMLLITVLFKARKQYLAIVVYLLSLIITVFIYNRLGMPRMINKHPPGSIGSLELVKTVPPGKTVYFTGSNVFWVNAFLNVIQLRGGRDEISRLSGWQKDSFILRESHNEQEVKAVIKNRNIDYVFVNTSASFNFYKDFKNLDLWNSLGGQVGQKNGDYLISGEGVWQNK